MQHEVWDLAVADQVAAAMGELPEEERRAIELAYFDGHTYREVATLLDQPEGTVKSRIRNGMRRMRAVLADAGVRGVDGVMSHDEASELLGAYALDAVDGDEHTELEAHLETCPRCRAELDSLREVAAAMGNSVEPLPEGLWSHIASRLPERQADEEPPPMPRLTTEAHPPLLDLPCSGGRTAPAPAHVITAVAAAAVAVAAVAVVLGIGLVRADNRASNLQAQIAQHPPRRWSTRWTRRGATWSTSPRLRTGTSSWPSSSSCPTAGAISSRRPCRRSARARPTSCGGSIGSGPISLGLLGSNPHQATFTMAGSNRPSRLSITAEPAGGVVAPTTADRGHRDCLTPQPSC